MVRVLGAVLHCETAHASFVIVSTTTTSGELLNYFLLCGHLRWDGALSPDEGASRERLGEGRIRLQKNQRIYTHRSESNAGTTTTKNTKRSDSCVEDESVAALHWRAIVFTEGFE